MNFTTNNLARSWVRRNCGKYDTPDDIHCVRIRQEPDDSSDIEYLFGDSYSHTVHPEIDPEDLDKQRADKVRRIEYEGVWGAIAEYWCAVEGCWKDANRGWGFVGNDFEASGYDEDFKRAALALRTASVRAWRAMCKAAP